MKELRSEVEALIDIELERANEQFPLFNSLHEGVSVIREEMLEAKADMLSLQNCVDSLEAAVFYGFELEDEKLIHLRVNAEREAKELACEAIQTAAMLRKFTMNKQENENPADEPFSQEEADALAERNGMTNRAHKEEFNHFMQILFMRMAENGKEADDNA